MVNTLLGTKKEMTATYDSRQRRVGATVVLMTPNFVTQVNEKSIQLGYGSKKSVKKPQIGHGKKAGMETPIRWFREVEKSGEDLQPGTEIKLDQVFSIGDAVQVTGTSKGKGFQGGVRRHGFHGGPKTHGQSDRLRAPGAIGSGTTPGRVYKGKKMAGHMGDERVSIKNLEVVGLDVNKSLLMIKGGIPGSVGSLVMVTKLGKTKGYIPPPEEKPEEEELSEENKELSQESIEQKGEEDAKG
ncbi:50S ribosomal protein L3 [Patescibacteria group bacterium]|nr:50S ribosomal protein L3 [Patescibacteria group bacterium]